MQFEGNYLIGATRERVWEALNDTEVLRACIPGCKRIVWVTDTGLELEISVNLGLFKPVFAGDLALSDIHPAERYTLTGRGRGGLLGFARGKADIALGDHDEGSTLAFGASAEASNEIMALGSSLVGRRAQSVIDGFFMRFGRAMGASVEPLGRVG